MDCGTVLHVLREEFRLMKFGFGNVDDSRFYMFQFRSPPIVYILYRLFLTLYTMSWLIVTRNGSIDGGKLGWGVFLTNWTYIVLTIYLTTHLVAAVVYHIYKWRQGGSIFRRTEEDVHNDYFRDDDDMSMQESPKVHFYIARIVVWVIYNAVSTGALVVTIIFWTSIYPTMPGGPIGNYNLQLHILNSLIIFIEHFVTAVPFRILHFIYPFVYLLLYTIFSAIYWAGDHSRVIYDILDWNKPGPTTGVVLLIGLIVVPLLHFLFYLIYKLRVFAYKRLAAL
ncbi:protein rolling stone [Patella vulgata]|uniref:protein rolling stone n=1 Tax=Patella vulgata TaxID=6465 RepID=UPI00217FD07E|nr:protein rolling stone [Patella vulgata]